MRTMLLKGLQSGNEMLQLQAVIQLNDALSLSTEESLGGFQVFYNFALVVADKIIRLINM